LKILKGGEASEEKGKKEKEGNWTFSLGLSNRTRAIVLQGKGLPRKNRKRLSWGKRKKAISPRRYGVRLSNKITRGAKKTRKLPLREGTTQGNARAFYDKGVPGKGADMRRKGNGEHPTKASKGGIPKNQYTINRRKKLWGSKAKPEKEQKSAWSRVPSKRGQTNSFRRETELNRRN